MSEIKEIICVNCPKGCHVQVKIQQHNIISITGNACDKGEAYAKEEITCPKRILTTTIRIHHALHRVLPIISDAPIPLEIMGQAMQEIKKIEIEAPVSVNQVIVPNILDTGVNIIASKTMIRQ